MIRSMTGFARAGAETPQGQLLWELRSVNHRYLEAQIRLPEGFRALEADTRAAIGRAVRRGKLDATLVLRASNRGEGGIIALLALAAGAVHCKPRLRTRQSRSSS